MLGRQRTVRAHRSELGLRLAHGRHGLRQHLRDLGKRRVLLHELTAESRQEPLDLLAETRLRQRDHRRALAKLLCVHPATIALHIEGGRDDLALLL